MWRKSAWNQDGTELDPQPGQEDRTDEEETLDHPTRWRQRIPRRAGNPGRSRARRSGRVPGGELRRVSDAALQDEFDIDELGGPFIETYAGVELASSLDDDMREPAEPEPFPTALRSDQPNPIVRQRHCAGPTGVRARSLP